MDCSTLKDEKWHFIVMNRYIKTLSISIDGIEIYKAPFEFPLNRIISLGNSIITADTGARLYQI